MKRDVKTQIEDDDLDWIKEKVEEERFQSLSHALRRGVKLLRREEEKRGFED